MVDERMESRKFMRNGQNKEPTFDHDTLKVIMSRNTEDLIKREPYHQHAG